MGVQNVNLPRGLYFFTLFSVLFLLFIHGFLPARGRKTDYIINMAFGRFHCICAQGQNNHWPTSPWLVDLCVGQVDFIFVIPYLTWEI